MRIVWYFDTRELIQFMQAYTLLHISMQEYYNYLFTHHSHRNIRPTIGEHFAVKNIYQIDTI